jgi:hypothetical protein
MNKKTMVEEYCINVIKPIFPDNADIKPLPSDNIVLQINWLLNTDKSDPNKKSKTIVFTIPKDCIEDFGPKIGARLVPFVQNLFSQFNPENDSSSDISDPIERWIFTP